MQPWPPLSASSRAAGVRPLVRHDERPAHARCVPGDPGLLHRTRRRPPSSSSWRCRSSGCRSALLPGWAVSCRWGSSPLAGSVPRCPFTSSTTSATSGWASCCRPRRRLGLRADRPACPAHQGAAAGRHHLGLCDRLRALLPAAELACSGAASSRVGRSSGASPSTPVGATTCSVSVVFFLCLLIARNVWRSGMGRRLRALRDNEDGGARLRRAATRPSWRPSLLQAFSQVSVAPSSVTRFARSSPSDFSVTPNINVVAFVVIGGIGLLAGPLLGALYIIGVPQFVPIEQCRAGCVFVRLAGPDPLLPGWAGPADPAAAGPGGPAGDKRRGRRTTRGHIGFRPARQHTRGDPSAQPRGRPVWQ